MGHIKDIIDLLEKFVERRRPLEVRCRFQGDRPPVFFVDVTNISRAEPVVIKEARVHFGMPEYNHAFVLMPREARDLPPKYTLPFSLPYEGAVVKKIITVENPTSLDYPLTLKSPGDLFFAIAKAKPDDSWVELDFNEFEHHQFLKGKVQPVFQRMLIIGRNTESQKGG